MPVAPAGPNGEIQLGGIDGPVLRPLTFGERAVAVSLAAASTSPRVNLCAELLRLATTHGGVAEQTTQEILALVLAGAELDAPPFVETTLLVAQATGWDAAQIARTQAVDIDRLAAFVRTPPPGSAWNTLLLAPRQDELLDAIRARLADRLLRRGNSSSPDRQSVQSADRVNPAGGGVGSRDRSIEWDGQASTAGPLPAAAALRPGTPSTYESLTSQDAPTMSSANSDGDRLLPLEDTRANAGRGGTPVARDSVHASGATHHDPVVDPPPTATSTSGTGRAGYQQFHRTPPWTRLVSPRPGESDRSHLAWPIAVRSDALPMAWPSDWSPLDASPASPVWQEIDQPHRPGPHRERIQQSDDQASDPLLRLADNLAALLNTEADLRGIDP